MAASVVVEAHRKRFTVKAGPMSPLSAVVADVLGQLKLGGEVAPSDCRLLLRGKPQDLTTPLRFANVGRDKLELITGREPVLGVYEAPKAQPAAPPAAAAPPAPVAPPAATQQQPVPAAAPYQQAAAAPAPQQQQQQPDRPAAPPAAQPAAEPSTYPPPPQHPDAPEPPAAASSSSAAPAGANDSHPSVRLFGRRVWVFTREAEEAMEGRAAGPGAAPMEEDDSFFEFTEADLRRAMASQAAQRAKQEGHLMTAAMREREEKRRAEAFGPVTIRLYLPDGMYCLQAALPAIAPLSEVLALARAALPPQAAAAAYLFTTPPRTVLRDLSLSLYAAKMVPAAKVHVGLDASKAPAGAAGSQLIRAEAAALAERPPERGDVMHSRPAGQQAAAAAGGSAAAGAASSSAAAAGAAARPASGGSRGVPKWLKLGGK